MPLTYDERIERLRASIKTIPDYPKPGILFYDITSLCECAGAFADTIELLVERYKGMQIDQIIASEARGFVFGAPVAARLGVGFVMARKPKKLPRETVWEGYDLEYGTAELHVHRDTIRPGSRVLVIDDLLATGGTAAAMVKLVKKLGGVVVESGFVIELPDLKGAELLAQAGSPTFSLLKFEGA
ncbi:MAG: adenine phosphoribosyltransferase [Duodenibacillus sp.]|nr:adenine phosphoribosyltransferase [Duodenibacillus sp.]